LLTIGNLLWSNLCSTALQLYAICRGINIVSSVV
jgi:hypothetical protein